MKFSLLHNNHNNHEMSFGFVFSLIIGYLSGAIYLFNGEPYVHEVLLSSVGGALFVSCLGGCLSFIGTKIGTLIWHKFEKKIKKLLNL